MAIVAPHTGGWYAPDAAGTLEDIVAPFFCVIRKNGAALYTSASPYTIVRRDIIKEPGRERSADPQRYRDWAGLFQRWLRVGILLKDREK